MVAQNPLEICKLPGEIMFTASSVARDIDRGPGAMDRGSRR
jgi:hypothetical protein